MPELPGTTLMPPGPSARISGILRSPWITCCRLYSEFRPSRTSTFASPRSASSSTTSFPRIASAMDRFTLVVVLPTPPFPLVTAKTRA